MDIKLKMDGLAEVLKKFTQLEGKTQGKILANAVKAGGAIIAERARELAPKHKRGRLKRKTAIKAVITKRKKTYGEVTVGHTKKYWWGTFVELGTKAHTITIPPHEYQRKSLLGKVYTVRITKPKTVQHPGHWAQPHLRPAFDQLKQKAIDLAREHIAKEVAKLTK